MSDKGKAFAILLLVEVMWGIDFINLEYLNQIFSAQFVNFGRVLISGLVFFAAALGTGESLRFDKKDIWRIAVCGLLSLTLFGLAESLGIRMAGGALASLVMATVPVMGMIGDKLFFGNPLTAPKTLSVFISIGGVALLIFGGEHEEANANLPGVLLMLAAGAMWVAYLVIIKPLNEKYSTVSLMSGLYLVGTVTALPLAIPHMPPASAFGPMPIFILVASGVFIIALSMYLYIYSSKYLSVTIMAACDNVLPVVTCAAAFFVFGTRLTGRQLFGGLLIMVCVTCVSLLDSQTAKQH